MPTLKTAPRPIQTSVNCLLRENWQTSKVIDIALKLRVSKYTILRRARKLGIEKKPTGGPRPQYYEWDPEEDAVLTATYETKSNIELAEMLGVSVQAIMQRMTKLGLSRGNHGRKHHQWTNQDVNILITEHRKGTELSEIAARIGISQQTLKRKAKHLGLKRK